MEISVTSETRFINILVAKIFDEVLCYSRCLVIKTLLIHNFSESLENLRNHELNEIICTLIVKVRFNSMGNADAFE